MTDRVNKTDLLRTIESNQTKHGFTEQAKTLVETAFMLSTTITEDDIAALVQRTRSSLDSETLTDAECEEFAEANLVVEDVEIYFWDTVRNGK